MRDSGQKRMTAILGGGLAFFMISGCAIKHSDVMLFGTNTKYGLSIAADMPENSPHVNIGYKRQEFVWMPLVANGADSVIQSKVKNASAQDLKYIGKEPTGKEDTYSVLASFGADFKAGGGSAGGGIAQYFATGMAARKLADVGGASLVQASNVNLIPSSETVKAVKDAEIATIKRDESIFKDGRLDRTSSIIDKIEKLDSSRATELAKSPPVTSATLEEMLKKDDPANKRFDDAETAKAMLKQMVVMGEINDATLDAWEKALSAEQ